MRPAVFLDRDGTMVHDVGYLSRLDDLRWFPWTIEAVRLLNRAGFLVCVTTNQGGVGLGYYPETFVQRVHDVMTSTLAAAGARVDGWFYCPHHPQARSAELRRDCECRKPKTGLITQAAARFDIDLRASFVVGDKDKDVELATNAGARGILVRTGYGQAELERRHNEMPGAAFIAADLMEATTWILEQAGFPREVV
jgi:D-glycero-D-manno-heptose 1,7-bisphosphate phosphatase